MGSDNGSSVVVRGVQRALGSVYSISKLYLVGDQKELEKELKACGCNDSRIEIYHASQVLSMTDKPVDGLRRKKDCSIARATELVKKGDAQVLVSAGNTGGVVASAHIRLRPLKGVERPAIAAVIPARDNS
ncbi:MAG: phosphate acyltransferase PlsX, partial [Verrucomicrobia bacterium]|nr:phosphate acyltransferase PlsX [Verrucomicrobiota bacterium]